MEEKSCELGDTFQDGGVMCIDDPERGIKVCIKCSEGMWERTDSEPKTELNGLEPQTEEAGTGI